MYNGEATDGLDDRLRESLGLDALGWRCSRVAIDGGELLLVLQGGPGTVTLTLRPLDGSPADARPAYWQGRGVAIRHQPVADGEIVRILEALRAMVARLDSGSAQRPAAGPKRAAQMEFSEVVGALLARERARRSAPLFAALRSLALDAEQAGADAALLRRACDEMRRAVLDTGLAPSRVEPSIALGDAAFRATWHACDPDLRPAQRAAAAVQTCAAFGVDVKSAPLAAFLDEADRFVLVGVALAAGRVRPKLYLFAPGPDDALRVAAQALGLPIPDPRAHLIGIDFLAGGRDLKSYVRLAGDERGQIDDVALGPWLRAQGLPVDRLEIHACSRRDERGQLRDRSLHVHFSPVQGEALARAWALERGGAPAAARVEALAAAASLRLRVLSATVGGGAEHAYLSVGPGD